MGSLCHRILTFLPTAFVEVVLVTKHRTFPWPTLTSTRDSFHQLLTRKHSRKAHIQHFSEPLWFLCELSGPLHFPASSSSDLLLAQLLPDAIVRSVHLPGDFTFATSLDSSIGERLRLSNVVMMQALQLSRGQDYMAQ